MKRRASRGPTGAGAAGPDLLHADIFALVLCTVPVPTPSVVAILGMRAARQGALAHEMPRHARPEAPDSRCD